MKKLFLLLLTFAFSSFVFSQTYNGTGGSISDDINVNEFSLNVTGLAQANISSAYGLTSVCVDISHPFSRQMEVHIVAPDGTDVLLFSGLGWSGSNFLNTCLSGSAPQVISAYFAPYSGTFKHQDSVISMYHFRFGYC